MFVIDKKQCACCHNCACECPMQAIDYVGNKYEIDQEKCVQCGRCAKVCHTGACHEEPANPNLIQRHAPLTLECDVVVVGSGSGWGASYVKETMIDAITKQNLDVQIYLNTAATRLLVDETGAISGVKASDPGGELTIRCGAVMLVCGGMGRGDEKLQKYFGFFDGDGVEPDEEHMFCSIFGIKHHPFNNVLADLALQPEVLQINLNGQRWVNEQEELMGMTPRIKDQPKMIGYAITSREMYKMIADRFPEKTDG